METGSGQEKFVIELDTIRAQRLARDMVGEFLRLAGVQANSREFGKLNAHDGRVTGLLGRQWDKQADDLSQFGATPEIVRGIQEHCYLFAYYLLCVMAEIIGNGALSEDDIARVLDSVTQECFEFFGIDTADLSVVDIPRKRRGPQR
jgi:hypothetical protein